MASRLRRIAESPTFQAAIFAAIVANAIVLGLETYDGIDDSAGGLLDTLNDVFLGIFVVELAIRIGAHGNRPLDFFRDPWNLFDFMIVSAAFVPGLRENATLLRLVRLLRVLRIVSVLPDLRILTSAMAKAVPPIASMGVLALMLIYVYAMIGWILFGDEDPARWGNVGEAMLTLFTVLTLEGWNEVLWNAQEIHPQSWIFFITFVLIASLLLINILIAVIINAMEEARDSEHRAEKGRLDAEAEALGHDMSERAQTEAKILALKKAINDLEEQLGIGAPRRQKTVTRRMGR